MPKNELMTLDEWADLYGETRHDREAPPNATDETVKCSQCRERVPTEETRLCAHAGCERPVCTACEKEGLLVMEHGVLTCGRCSQR